MNSNAETYKPLSQPPTRRSVLKIGGATLVATTLSGVLARAAFGQATSGQDLKRIGHYFQERRHQADVPAGTRLERSRRPLRGRQSVLERADDGARDVLRHADART